MRKTVYAYLTGQSGLIAQVPVGRWKQAGDVIDTPQFPFVVLRWLAPVPGNASGRYMKQLRVEHYSARGSYSAADAFLGSPDTGQGVYGALSGLLDYVGTDARITQADYLGHSGDQESEIYKSNLKFSSWRMIGVDL
jgi:hypothetical protein